MTRNNASTHRTRTAVTSLGLSFVLVFAMFACVACGGSSVSSTSSAGSSSSSSASSAASAAQSASAASAASAAAASERAERAAAASAEAAAAAAEAEAAAEAAIPDGAISWEEAPDYVGETVSVYGPVAGTKFASSSNGGPTFLDIGADYPDPSRVTVLIWGEDRANFSSAPERYYQGKTICVSGKLTTYNGACQIEVSSPNQIEVL